MDHELKQIVLGKIENLSIIQGSVSYDDIIGIDQNHDLGMTEIEGLLNECENKGISIRENYTPVHTVPVNNEQKEMTDDDSDIWFMTESDDYEDIKASIKIHHENASMDTRRLCALVTRDFQRKVHKLKGYNSFATYAVNEYGINRSQMNSYRRVGERFLKKDSNGLANINGETILKEKYDLDTDFSIAALIRICSLSDDEIDLLIKEKGLNPGMSMDECRRMVNNFKNKSDINSNMKKADAGSSQIDAIIRDFKHWPEEKKDELFESELKRRYNVSAIFLDELLKGNTPVINKPDNGRKSFAQKFEAEHLEDIEIKMLSDELALKITRAFKNTSCFVEKVHDNNGRISVVIYERKSYLRPRVKQCGIFLFSNNQFQAYKRRICIWTNILAPYLNRLITEPQLKKMNVEPDMKSVFCATIQELNSTIKMLGGKDILHE